MHFERTADSDETRLVETMSLSGKVYFAKDAYKLKIETQVFLIF